MKSKRSNVKMTTRLWAQRKRASSTTYQIVTMHLLKWRFPLTKLPSTFKLQVESTNSSPRYQLTLWTSTNSRAIFLDKFSPVPKCVYLVPLNPIPYLNSKLSKLARYKTAVFFLDVQDYISPITSSFSLHSPELKTYG